MQKFSLLLLLTMIVSGLFSCKTEELEQLNAEEFKQIIENSISSDTIPVDRISELDPYESFFIAKKASEYGYSDEAVLIARYSWKTLGGFIGEKAAELCISLNMESGNLSEAEFYASIAAAEYPENYSFKRSAAEAEYWQHEDETLIESLNQLDKYSEAAEDYELLLFRAVASYRLKVADWRDSWVELFLNAPSSEYIRRGWEYLKLEIEQPYNEFPDYSELIKAKYHYSTGKYREASAYFTSFISQEISGSMTETVILDIENSFLRSGQKKRGAQLLEEAGLGWNLSECLFSAARLYRRAGLNYDAGRCMDLLINREGGRPVSERELWYSFDIKVRSSLSDAVDSIDFYIENWTDPNFFSDSLDNLCTALARRRRWTSISQLALKLEKTGPSETYDRFRYISERAASLGLIEPPVFTVPYSSLYYRILNRDSLLELRVDAAAANAPRASAVLNEAERYIDGLYRYGLDDVFDEIKKYSSLLSEDFLSFCSDVAASSGKPLEAIRIMYQYSGELSASGLMRLYPALYRNEIEKNSNANNIPEQLMFGIVWKESGFENEIVSRSGAVGLSQLMPATAEDVAGRTRTSVLDLTDPDENLSLGSWYLDWLTGYVGNTATAVLSYNGGPGRVKGWLRDYNDLPLDLFYEVVPVAETHQYGKRVLTASVIYGLLYYNIDPEKTLSIFF